MKRLLPVLLLFLCSCPSIPQQYVEADKATYDVIAEDYMSYVRRDESLGLEQAARRQRLIDSWRVRIEKALGANDG